MARAEGLALLGLVFLIVAAESAVLLDLVVPGEVGLVVAGAAAAQNGTPLPAVILFAALGAVAGDLLGYEIGRRYGTTAVERWSLTRRYLSGPLVRAADHFDRHGGLSVALARWIGALRAVVPLVAGAAGLPVRELVAWDGPSSLVWATVVASVGFVWGEEIAESVDRIGLVLTVAVAVAGVAFGLRALRRRRARR